MKTLKLALLTLILFFTMSMTVSAKTFTNKDVEAKLQYGINYVNGLANENLYISMNEDNVRIIKTSTDGQNYVTEFKYQNGIYTYTSTITSLADTESQIKNFYNGLSVMAFMSSVVSIYDEEIKNAVKDIEVKSTLTDDHLLETDHGIAFIDEPAEEIKIELDSGMTATINSIIRNIKIDLNNQKFQKLATTLENESNPLNLIIQLEKVGTEENPNPSPDPGDTKPDPTPNPGDNTDDPKEDDKNNDLGTGTGDEGKPDTPPEKDDLESEEPNYKDDNKQEGTPSGITTVPNPHTGIKDFMVLLLIGIVCIPILIYFNKKNIFKKL